MNPRELAIVDLLRLYRDLEGGGPMGGTGGDRGDSRLLYAGEGAWDKSGCDALDGNLSVLRNLWPWWWWNVTERYLRCDVRPRRIKCHRSASGRLRLPKPGPFQEFLGEGVRPTDSWLATELLVVVESWSPRVEPETVRCGVGFLAKHFPWERFRWSDLMMEVAA